MRHIFSLIAGLAMLADTVLPIWASTHIGWLRWKVPIILCAAMAFICLSVFAIMTIVEERREKARWEKRDKQQEEANAKLTSLLERVTRGPNPSQETREDPIAPSNPLVLSAHEKLKLAEEEVFVDEVLQMSDLDLKINLGHDPEFRNKFEAIPRGKYQQFDGLRDSIAGKPLIAARFMRGHLMPWSPFSGMVKDLFKSMGKPDYETRADFLFQIHLVNITRNTTTLQQITAEAEIDGKWIKLPRLEDLSNYELLTFQHKEDADGPLARDKGKVEELPSLWDMVKGRKLEYGIGLEGWVGFEVTAMSTEFDKPINHRVRLVDAMGGIHPVVTLKAEPEPGPYGELRHSKKMYNRS
jgi:hypothetical protein